MWTPRIGLWLEIVTNFLYYICVSPFKIEFNQDKNTYTLYSTALSKILSGSIHIVGILSSWIGMYSAASSLSLQNPKCIFHSAVEYSRYVIYYTLLFTFWTRRSHFNTFFLSRPAINLNSFEKKPIDLNSETKAKILAWVLCIFMIPSAISIEILNNTGVSGFSEYITATYIKGSAAVLVAFGFRSEVPTIPANMTAALFQLSDLEYGFTLFHDVIRNYYRVCNNTAVLFCIFAGVTMYQQAATFVSAVEEDRDQEKVIQKYVDFNQFGYIVNKMCGYLVFGTVVCSPPFFIVYFIGTFTSWEYTGPRVVLYSGLYCFLYVIAAEAASKIGEFKEWIIEYGEGDNESQLFAMFVEISQNPMGLRGLECFTITYGFLSKMFAIIVTFTIILLQFETTPASSITDPMCH